MSRLGTVVVAIGLLVFAGCGGGDSSSCGGAPACGGTIAPGTYNIVSTCVALSGTIPASGCAAGIGLSARGLTATGTWTFTADGTLTVDESVSGTIDETFPASCLNEGGMQLSCAQLDTLLKSQAGSDPSVGSVTCAGRGDCVCTITAQNQKQMESATWMTSGTNLVIKSSDGSMGSNPYCVAGSQLTVHAMDTGMAGLPMMSGEPTGSATFVLEKQ